MLAWLHKQFIPHEGNDHKPHFLRPKNAAKVLAAVVFVEIVLLSQVYVFPQFKDFLAAVLPGVLVDLANSSRADFNAGELKVNPFLVISAQMKAEHMARNGYFAHDSPTGETPWVWFAKAGYKFLYAGENLAVHFVDSEDVHRAWMASQTHRANILNPNFNEIGIGVAEGLFQGRNALFIVQHFGRPAESPPVVNPVIAISNTAPAESGTGSNQAAGEAETPKEPASESAAQAELNPSSAAEPLEISGEFAGSITIPEVNFVSRVFSMPTNLTLAIFAIALAIVSVALTLKVFIKIRVQHPPLILAGVSLIIVISGLIAANYYLLTLPGQTL